MNPGYRKRQWVDPIQAPDVNRPTVKGLRSFPQFLGGRDPWFAKRQYAASWAEVIFGRLRSPLIERQRRKRREQPKIVGGNSKVQRATLQADRAIANPNVVDFGVHLESDSTAMAGATVRLLHVAPLAAMIVIVPRPSDPWVSR